MPTQPQTAIATPDAPSAVHPVWDLPVRLFHWSLVALVATALVTGFLAPAWWLGVHRLAGYGIGLLLVLRLVWGRFGPTHARFRDFLFSPAETAGHVAGLLRGRPDHYRGHNPAGALMVFALLAVLALLVASGLVVEGGQEKLGLFKGLVGYATGHGLKQGHEALALLLLGLIGGHLLGVLVESRLARDNLVRAMIDGRKRSGSPRAGRAPQAAAPGKALAVLAGLGLPGAGLGYALATLPPLGLPALADNPLYRKECGDCHPAYHPSLLPAASWRQTMAGLDEHFGEDARLDPATAGAIATWLVANAAEGWDSEAANNLRRIDAAEPLRITATPFWQSRHRHLGQEVFARRSIGSKVNCAACHADASTGRFDDARIAVPNG